MIDVICLDKIATILLFFYFTFSNSLAFPFLRGYLVMTVKNKNKNKKRRGYVVIKGTS